MQKFASRRISQGEKAHLQNIECELLEGDLLDQNFCQQATKGVEVLFHLAADHGGRGYIDSHQVECSTNMILDGQVFRHAHQNGVEKLFLLHLVACIPPPLKWM